LGSSSMANSELVLVLLLIAVVHVTAMQSTTPVTNLASLSLTKSWFYFLFSVFQTVVLFIFFWQRREVTLPTKDLRSTHTIRNDTKPNSEKAVTQVVQSQIPEEEPEWDEKAFISRISGAGAKGIGKMMKKADASLQKGNVRSPVTTNEKSDEEIKNSQLELTREKSEKENIEKKNQE